MPTYHEIVKAIARGYCAPKNTSKEMDPDLVTAIAEEIADLFSISKPKGD